MRIGRGTIDACTGQPAALDGGDQARLVGPRMATWSPGATPRCLQGGAHRPGLLVELRPGDEIAVVARHEAPTNRMPLDVAAALQTGDDGRG